MKRNLKKVVSLLLSAVMLLGVLAGCGGTGKGADNASAPAADGVLTLRLSHVANELHVSHRAALYLKTLLEEQSGGRIELEVYPNGQLGAERETLESLQRGDCDFAISSTAPLVMFNPQMAVFDIPFLMLPRENLDQTFRSLFQVMDSEPAKELLGTLSESGLHGIAFTTLGFRQLTANKPVERIEDLKGMKIRTMENKYHMALWQALGANPTPMASSEVFTALEQGTIEAQENEYGSIYNMKYFEAQDYLINTNHILCSVALTMSEKTYQALPDDLRDIVLECCDEMVQYWREEAITEAENCLDQLRANGMIVIEPDVAELQHMAEAVEPVRDSIREDIGAELVDRIIAEAEKA